MDSKELNPIEKIQQCIKNHENFVLQGGAGSGKTETLKNVVEHVQDVYPDKKIACITHTINPAVKYIYAA